MHNYWREKFIQILILFNLYGCAYPTPHENFIAHMNFNIGKSIDDSNSYIARYPELVINTQLLPNGNLEKEFRVSEACKILFEIDSKTRVITQWRSKDSGSQCVISP